jgi:hypothetical protein
MALIGVLLLLGIALLIPLTAVVLDSQVGRAIASRLEGDKDQAGTLPGRVTSLESDVDRLNQLVQRLEEESQFMQRLLEERSAPEELLPPGEGKS